MAAAPAKKEKKSGGEKSTGKGLEAISMSEYMWELRKKGEKSSGVGKRPPPSVRGNVFSVPFQSPAGEEGSTTQSTPPLIVFQPKGKPTGN